MTTKIEDAIRREKDLIRLIQLDREINSLVIQLQSGTLDQEDYELTAGELFLLSDERAQLRRKNFRVINGGK